MVLGINTNGLMVKFAQITQSLTLSGNTLLLLFLTGYKAIKLLGYSKSVDKLIWSSLVHDSAKYSPKYPISNCVRASETTSKVVEWSRSKWLPLR